MKMKKRRLNDVTPEEWNEAYNISVVDLPKPKLKSVEMRKLISQEYIYLSEVLRVVDGDTVDVLLDLSFGVFRKVRVRANGIDTPESRTRNKEEKKLGLAAKARMKKLCGKKIFVESLNKGKLDKYGRLLANLYTEEKRSNICEILIREGHAVKYDGSKKTHVWA